jgi:GNAT superfamily N-acetyltransferase
MTTVYKLKDYRDTIKFEREHPKELRWDERYKLFMFSENKECQGIWFKDNKDLIAEVILTWSSDNVAHIDSFTVMPFHRGKGLGYDIISTALEWAKDMKYEYITGEARKGASWHIFENLGAESVLLHKNWCKTGEDYMSFKIEL